MPNPTLNIITTGTGYFKAGLIRVTKELTQAGRLLKIELLDHIILGHNRYVSMKEQGYFQP